MAEMGRPQKPIDWAMVDKLCAIQCTQEEIAAVFDCTIDTLNNRSKAEFGLTFSEYSAQKRGMGRISLRRMQWKSAEDGNVTMQIWLGKQMLNQRDGATFDTPRDEKPRLVIQYPASNDDGEAA